MYSSFFKLYFTILTMLTISICFLSYNSNFSNQTPIDPNELSINENSFTWPLPGNKRITSYFGKRNAPTRR